MATPVQPPRRGWAARPARAATGLGDERAGPVVAVELYPAASVQAAWRARPGLRAAPLAVAVPDGRILHACPLAVGGGVARGQGVAQGRLLRPDLAVVPPDPAAAALLYDDLLHALGALSPVVETTDPDTGVAYLDAGGQARLWGDDPARWDGLPLARAAVRILADRGIGARVGAGPTRVVALALARQMGAGGPRALAGDMAADFLRALPLDDPALGLTPATVAALRDLGVATAGALAALPRAGVALRFGADVHAAWRAASGASDGALRPWAPPERLVVARRIEGGVEDGEALRAIVRRLAVTLVEGLGGRGAATLTLRLECADGARHARHARYGPPPHTEAAMAAAALEILGRTQVAAPVEFVELVATDLRAPDATQPGLWGDEEMARRRARLAAALAAHGRRHGAGLLRHWRPDPLAADGWVRDEDGPGPGP